MPAQLQSDEEHVAARFRVDLAMFVDDWFSHYPTIGLAARMRIILVCLAREIVIRVSGL